jgi:hypothetical protein
MKTLVLSLGYIGCAFFLIKAYFHLQYDRQRRKTGSLFFRWIFGIYPLSIPFPILSTPRTDKELKLKKIANTAVVLFYVFFVLTLVMVYVIYKV